MRSGTNANDFATTVDVLLEVINKYEMQGQEFDNICCIYPTAVLLPDTPYRETTEIPPKHLVYTPICHVFFVLFLCSRVSRGFSFEYI